MKPEIENLKVWMSGRSTTGYQRALAMREFEQLLTYVAELEQLRQPLVLPAVFSSIEEAVKELGLSKRVRWKLYHGYLCRYTKKDICPEFVVKDGIPVVINGR